MIAPTTVVQSEVASLPLGDGTRSLGAEATAEQRELIGLLLDDANKFSGFARRGILMRLLDLADLTEELFEGSREDDPYVLASKLHGMGNKNCSDAAAAIRIEREKVRQ